MSRVFPSTEATTSADHDLECGVCGKHFQEKVTHEKTCTIQSFRHAVSPTQVPVLSQRVQT